MLPVLKYIVIIGACFTFIGAAEAEDGERSERRVVAMVDMRVSRIQERIGVSDIQANKIAALMIDGLVNDDCRERETYTARRNCREAKKETIEEEIEGLLTTSQLEQFEEMQKEREERKSARKSPRQGRSGYRGRHSLR